MSERSECMLIEQCKQLSVMNIKDVTKFINRYETTKVEEHYVSNLINNHRVHVAKENNKIIGVIVFFLIDSGVEVRHLTVDEERKGVAELLFEIAKKEYEQSCIFVVGNIECNVPVTDEVDGKIEYTDALVV